MARILVVDDEEGVRSFLADALELSGHTVVQAASGEQALEVLTRQAFHVMLTDLKMPGIDGLTLLGRAKEAWPELEVVVLTAHGSVDNAVEAMKQGAFDYLQKPVGSPGELRQLVDRAVERHRLQALREVAADEGPLRLSWGAPAMEPVVQALRKVAPTDATVLLLGESGTGKEVAARALHRWSRRSQGPFVVINCATLNENLLESELFGHERGAFTGASGRRRGKLELADGGTFFLDEVGELDLALQARLLRAIQERRFERVGGNQTVEVDVRWIAATNRDLTEQVQQGAFREDLYFRLAVFPVSLPPLRARPEDIEPLARQLLRLKARELGRPGLGLSEAALRHLRSQTWPGNVRELANALERAAILASGSEIEVADLAGGLPALAVPGAASSMSGVPTMEEVEREAIRRALAHYDGNRRKAAQHLGIGERTLYDKIKRFELS